MKHFNLEKKALALAVGLSTILVGIGGPVLAQEDDEIEEVYITGTRLTTNPNLSSPTPILTVTSADIANRGTVRLEDLLNTLPQVFSGQAGEVSNGATGTSQVNLRALGAIRTLSLINGRRLPYGSSSSSAVNIDVIPTSLVERVDIQTGGGSAVYGSDAIAGVANFILKQDFEGLEIDVQTAASQNDNSRSLFSDVLEAGGQPVPDSNIDGENVLISFTAGKNFFDGRGNVTFFASYEDQEEIVQADRTFSACTLGASTADTSVGGFGCVGSANFRLFGGPGGFFFQEENGGLTPFAGGPAQTFNFGAQNFFQRPSERINLYLSSRYDLTESIELYSNVSYVDNESDAQIAPTASFGIGAYSTNCDNPLLVGSGLSDVFGCESPGQIVSGLTASHRNVEGGARSSLLENETIRFESGIKGEINDVWKFDVFSLFSTTEDTSTATNDFVVANLQQALFATTDANGNVVCVDQSNGCVPYNPFQRTADGQSLITQESLDFIQGVGVVDGETEQISFGGNIQADLGEYGFRSPLSENGIGFLVGFEYREDTLETSPDAISQIPGGGFTGVGGATLPVAGEVEVTEFYLEAQIPLVTDRSFAQELTLSGQYRFSDYDTDGNGIQNSFDTDTYGLSLNWTPVESVRFRGQFQRAVRAPNVIELFEGQDQGLENLNTFGVNGAGIALFDPCASNAPILSLEQCAQTGVTADQFGSILDVISGQTQIITGGNPLLEPESSDTTTLGVVITPESVPGLNITIDYFDISIDDLINDGIPAQTVLNNCLNTGDPTFCGLITRSATGSLASGGPGFGFQATNLNIANLTTSGVDVQTSYAFDTASAGSFDLRYNATFVDEYSFVPFPGGEAIECAGFFGNSCFFDLTPEYRHNVNVGWQTPWNVNANLTWRHFGSVDNVQGEDAADVDQTLESVDYFDLSVNFNISDGLSFRAGVNNLTNEDAPISISSGPPLGNGNTFPSIYDTGRFFFLGVNWDL